MPFVEIAFSDLDFFEKLGGGATGTVYRGKWKSKNVVVAIKKLLLLEKEAEVLSSLSHRNVVQFFGAVVVAPNYCLVTEFAEQGSLYDYLRKQNIEFQQILLWAKQIALGMNYLHYEAPIPVIHRDLKSRNVVIAMDLTAKICDFGSSKFHQHTTRMSLVGTFPWMAPEVIQHLPITPACDVFSYSIVLWELLAQEVPFKGLEGLQIAWLVVAKNERLVIPSSCPPPFARLMRVCWAVEPKERPTFKQILDVLDAMLDNELLQEETGVFLQKKEEWKEEIDTKLTQLKSMEHNLTNKQVELDKREKILEEKEKQLIQEQSQFQEQQPSKPRNVPEAHDVSSWSEHDVADWVHHVSSSTPSDQLSQYADLFIKNNISGHRLFMLTGDDLLQIGMLSVGHRRELLDQIVQLRKENFRLLNFPPLPGTSVRTTPPRPVSFSGKTETLTVLFGCVSRGPPEKRKRKFFVDLDGSHAAINSVKDVSLVFSKSLPRDVLTITKPPFITETWKRRSIHEPVECALSYKTDVVSMPTNTTHLFFVREDGSMEELSVELTLIPKERRNSGNRGTPSGTTGNDPAESTRRLSGAWADRAMFTVTPLDSSETTNMPNFTPQDSLTSSTASLHSQHSHPATPGSAPADMLDYRGKPLQGVWGKGGITAAAMIKSTLAPTPAMFKLPSSGSASQSSSRSATPIRAVSSGELQQASSNQRDFSKGSKSCSAYDLKRQASDWRGRGHQSHRGGHEGGNYQRSVSDNTSVQQHYHRRTNRPHPSSEPNRRGRK